MKTVEKFCAQGDVCFRRVDKLPENATAVGRNGDIIVAHSESGHHHVIADSGVVQFDVGNPFVCYLQVEGMHADVVHRREFDTHETVRLSGGGTIWEVKRQREHAPEGIRLAAD